MDYHRLFNRDLRGSPLATHCSTQEQIIVTIHVSSAHARKYFFLFYLPEKSGNMKSVGFEPTTHRLSVI